MFKLLFLCLCICFGTLAFAKTIEVDVFADSAAITEELPEFDLMTLNGIRLSLTSELENLKYDSNLFWKKIEEKKLSPADELKFLKPLFSAINVSKNVQETNADAPIGKTATAPKEPSKLSGALKAELDLEKLKIMYEELANNLEETKQKTFYILPDIEMDSSMTLEDLGVTKIDNFNGAIIDSWKKMVEKEFKGFESVKILEKDFAKKPDYMNAQSVTLKWNSTFRKTGVNPQKKTAFYELLAQFVLVNTKSGLILASFDFPAQKRELDVQNQKGLSSALASLVYNLLFSQTQKIQSAIESRPTSELVSLQLKVSTKMTLSELVALNSLIEERLKDLKGSSRVKSFSLSDDSLLAVEANGGVDQILDKLALDGGKYLLNQQKILLFNRADKSFAILPKDSNN